ncbi:hypothetical protein G7Y89_g7603 [Cudoniella acicularis]|uniref:Uncharacterized protein n=1 Tax=Cudoniella acicularis TaxID=354080 RepID=A0A8H4W1T4_9HELO|nr:hypothetical protein G7Y89_g7603 [Cudoniella acicularis]
MESKISVKDEVWLLRALVVVEFVEMKVVEGVKDRRVLLMVIFEYVTDEELAVRSELWVLWVLVRLVDKIAGAVEDEF